MINSYLKRLLYAFGGASVLLTTPATAQSANTAFPLSGDSAWALHHVDASRSTDHLLSGLQCPDDAGRYKMVKAFQGDVTGTGAYCVYVSDRQAEGAGDLYVHANFTRMNRTALDAITELNLNYKDNGYKLRNTGPATVRMGTSKVEACQYSVFDKPRIGKPGDFVVYTCQVGGYEYRLSSHFAREFKDDFTTAIKAIGVQQGQMLTLGQECKAMSRVTTPDPLKKGDRYINGKAFDFITQGRGCVRKVIDTGDTGLVFMAWPDSKNTLYSMHLKSSATFRMQPIFRLQDMTLGEGGKRAPVLVKEDNDGVLTAYRFYNGLPTVQFFYEDSTKVSKGELEPLLVATPKSGGGYNFEMKSMPK